MSSEGVLRVLEVQQEVDEQIAAEKEFDRWAIAREMTVPGEGWGGGQGKPVIPEDFFAPDHIQQRFEETL
jgi:hypothetical protein